MQPGWKARPEYHKLELVGPSEVAKRLGVTRATVDQWRHREVLPAPDWNLDGGPVWMWATIEQWAEATGRSQLI